jgi:phosphoenolpyruvate carboxylase
MITQNLGQEGMAEKTLDLFTAGVLAERFAVRPAPKKEWRDMMERLSTVSCAAYRKIVREEPRFVPYFRSATPELELSGLNVGSRPAKRNPKGGVESLRAIPWVFAWTQTRLNLPAWLGVGNALQKELETHPAILREMYEDWPWFRTIIDLVEMIVAKSEIDIAANYDLQLVHDKECLALGRELRSQLAMTAKTLLSISGHSVLQENNQTLLKSMAVRNPYVDPLNVIQAELLRRLRHEQKTGDDPDEAVLRDALLITINGIANGMRNSG